MENKDIENNWLKNAVDTKPVRWGQDRRLEFIDFRLQWDGRVNRSDLMDFFGTSIQQASLDFARYLETVPANMLYDRSQKTYLVTKEFKPLMVSPDAHRYLVEVLGVASGRISKEASFVGRVTDVAAVPFPNRQLDACVVLAVLRGIQEKLTLLVEYQSMNRPAPSERKISPHAIGFDGFRWHVRAFCHERHDFRDFVFARILKVADGEPSDVDADRDEAWTRQLTLLIAPHPDLTAGQRLAVELDYRMEQGHATLRTREALLFYVLRQLGFDESGMPMRTAQRQQIVLLNRNELLPLLQTRDN